MGTVNVKTPWEKSMGGVPMHIDYFDGTMFEVLKQTADRFPGYDAMNFLGKITDYKTMLANTVRCARAFRALGMREGDAVTIALPNCPQAMYVLYGVNLAGGVVNLIHPLAPENEIKSYVNRCGTRFFVTLDRFFDKAEHACRDSCVQKLITTSVRDELSVPMKLGYSLSEGRGIKKVPESERHIRWKNFLQAGESLPGDFRASRGGDDPAVILFTGGSTGTPMGAVLTNRNVNALGRQVLAANPMAEAGNKILAALPLFHGFGLGVCVHTSVTCGGCSILIPRFSVNNYGKLIVKHKCNFIAGVPTIYEAMMSNPALQKADLSFLKGIYCGGDTLPEALKQRFDAFVTERNSPVTIREGYGATETVAACCLTPPHMHKPGSVGVPFPDTYIKIVEPGTDREVPCGTEGEILIAGPTVMQGYICETEKTAETLKRHGDGLTWFRSGDLGTVDEDGFVFFSGRAKRMIVSSGNKVYPGQVENTLDMHPMVKMSCVIGIPDAYKMQRVKAFVMLNPGLEASPETAQTLLEYCADHMDHYSVPSEIEFRDSMPKSLVGKVAFRVLEEEERQKRDRT